MESRGNDERVKFVGPTISVRWRDKTCGPEINVNDHITLNFSNYLERKKVPKHLISLRFRDFLFWRRHPDLNRGIKVLQTSALPLGYVAL